MFKGNQVFNCIYVVQSSDASMNFIFLQKSQDKADTNRKDLDQMILMTLKTLETEKFTQIDQLWVPAFCAENENKSISDLEGFSLSPDNSLMVANAQQKTSVEFFTAPESDGTPKITPDYPKEANIKVIDNDFLFVAVHNSLEESLELPLFVSEVSRNQNWKKL